MNVLERVAGDDGNPLAEIPQTDTTGGFLQLANRTRNVAIGRPEPETEQDERCEGNRAHHVQQSAALRLKSGADRPLQAPDGSDELTDAPLDPALGLAHKRIVRPEFVYQYQIRANGLPFTANRLQLVPDVGRQAGQPIANQLDRPLNPFHVAVGQRDEFGQGFVDRACGRSTTAFSLPKIHEDVESRDQLLQFAAGVLVTDPNPQSL